MNNHPEQPSHVKHELYFWREEGPIEAAADSLRVRLSEDPNLPGVNPVSLPAIQDAFRCHFPDIIITDSGMEWKAADTSFQVSFRFDDCNQPTIVCVSSQSALVHTPEIFKRILAAVRELGCTRVESTIE